MHLWTITLESSSRQLPSYSTKSSKWSTLGRSGVTRSIVARRFSFPSSIATTFMPSFDSAPRIVTKCSFLNFKLFAISFSRKRPPRDIFKAKVFCSLSPWGQATLITLDSGPRPITSKRMRSRPLNRKNCRYFTNSSSSASVRSVQTFLFSILKFNKKDLIFRVKSK